MMTSGCSVKCCREGFELFGEDEVGEIVEGHVDVDC
jgi:hypothetical protein